MANNPLPLLYVPLCTSYLQTYEIHCVTFKSLTTIELTVKDSFYFAEEVVDQQFYLFIGSFDVDSLFTNILLEKTIKIWTNELFKKSETIKGSKKFEFKELLSLATKDSHFICDGTPYK